MRDNISQSDTLVLLQFLQPLLSLALLVSLFDQVGVAPTHVLHYLRRPNQVDQLVVHQVFLSELLPESKSADGLADGQQVVRSRVHFIRNQGHVAIKHRPNEPSNHQDN